MKKSKGMKKSLSFLLAARLALSCVPMGVLAAGDGLCAHHPEHTADCGYVETVEGHDCEHVCAEACRQLLTDCVHIHGTGACTYVEAQEGVDCTCGGMVHTAQCAGVSGGDCDCAMEPGHSADCGYSEDVPASGTCDHTACTEESGCVTGVEACIHTGHDAACGYAEAKGAPCAYVCQACAQADSGKKEDPEDTEEKNDTPTVRTVDFMEYLEDTILIAFQSSGNIDLHDYLVNAYGIPAEIPFTCSPAVVPYGEYEDGSLIPVTVTAGEGYEGSCSVDAEVRYMNSVVTANYLTTTFRIYQGNQKVAEKIFEPSNDLNDWDYSITDKWNVKLQADTEYKLEVSWGPPLYEGIGANTAQVVEMAVAGDFLDNASGYYKKLSVSGITGMNKISESGSASCNIKTSGYGAYAMHIALDAGDGDQNNKFKVNLTFQASGRESDTQSTVPQGTNIPLTAATRYAANYYNFSWTKDGESISGANGKTYTAPEAKPGDVYIATISRKADAGTGCTGSENWTHTFTVSEETVSIPTAIDGLVYNGSAQILCEDGIAPTGYNVYYYIPLDVPGLRIGYTYEDFWLNNKEEFFTSNYPGNAGTYTVRYFIANSGFYGHPLDGTQFQCLREGTLTCTIAQATPALNTAPSAITGLSFDGTSHALVTAGSATNGTVQYRLNGGAWSKDIPTATNAGTYTVEYRVAGENKNYKTLENENYKVTTTIAPADKNAFVVVMEPTEYVYDGMEKKPTISVTFGGNTLSEDHYSVEYQNNVGAGNATAGITSPNWTGSFDLAFKIAKKSLTNLRIENTDKVYDGSAEADSATIHCDGIVTTDSGKVQILANISYADANAGENKTITAENLMVAGEKAANYALETTQMTSTGTIRPMPITVTADNLTKTYGDEDPSLTWSVSPAPVDGDTLSVQSTREDGEAVREGGYLITVTEVQGANPNYDITFVGGIFTIQRKALTIDITASKQFDNMTGIDPGQDTFRYILTPNQVLTDDEVILDPFEGTAYFFGSEVGENLPLNLTGDFTISGADAGNYTLIQPTGVTGTIYNTYSGAHDFVATPTVWTNGSVSLSPKEGFLLAWEIDGDWSSQLTYAGEAASPQGNTVSFHVKNKNGDISLPVSITCYIDHTVPTGTIALKDREPWESLISDITFGMFFNYEQTVTITGADTLSGVEKIEYLESDAALTQADLDTAQWTEYRKPVPVSLEDAKQFVYYAKITDQAGNVTYLSTDGSVYDTTAPVIAISGKTEDHVYYTTQKITVSDANALEVTLNGQPATASFDIAGDVAEETTHIIAAKDQAGNVTKVTMTMRPISTLDDKIEDLTTDNATSADLEEIRKVLDTTEKLLEESIPEAEQEKLEDIQRNARKLKNAVEEAHAAINNSVTRKVEDKTEANAALEDKADLEAAKKLLEDALQEENRGNYTPAEQSEIRKELKRLEKAIAAIEQTEDVIEAIEKLPASVETNLDEKTEKSIRAAKAAYDQLTDRQKSLIDKDDRKKLDDLMAVLVDYRITQGPGKWEKGSDSNLRFTANGPDRKFKELRIDGKAVDSHNYYVQNGTIILRTSYLEKLSAGKHKVQVVYTDGETSGKDLLRIYNSGTNPATGDSMNLMLTGGLAAASLLCLAVMTMFILRKKETYQH